MYLRIKSLFKKKLPHWHSHILYLLYWDGQPGGTRTRMAPKRANGFADRCIANSATGCWNGTSGGTWTPMPIHYAILWRGLEHRDVTEALKWCEWWDSNPRVVFLLGRQALSTRLSDTRVNGTGYRIWTSDLLNVNQLHYRCANPALKNGTGDQDWTGDLLNVIQLRYLYATPAWCDIPDLNREENVGNVPWYRFINIALKNGPPYWYRSSLSTSSG